MAEDKPIKVYGENLELVEQIKATLPSKRNTTSLVNELIAEAALARLQYDDQPSASEVARQKPPPRSQSTGKAYDDF